MVAMLNRNNAKKRGSMSSSKLTAMQCIIDGLMAVLKTSIGYTLVFKDTLKSGKNMSVVFSGIDDYAAFDKFAVAYCCVNGVLLQPHELPAIRGSIRAAIDQEMLDTISDEEETWAGA